MGSLLRSPDFLLALVVMLCAGASEMMMSQWASLFAEEGLGVTKVLGDLAGPCLFAVLMGVARTIYGVWGEKIQLHRALTVCGLLCVLCYSLTVLAPLPAFSLAGCALCGFAVGILWPGTLSICSARFPLGGVAMFGMLAIAGDLGCSLGPWIRPALRAGSGNSFPACTPGRTGHPLKAQPAPAAGGVLCGIRSIAARTRPGIP